MKMEMQRALFETGLVEIKMDKQMGSVGIKTGGVRDCNGSNLFDHVSLGFCGSDQEARASEMVAR